MRVRVCGTRVMKNPLRVPFEATEPDPAGPRLVHEAGDGESQAAPSFCETLIEARVRGGYSVGDAARALRIQEHYLQALEDGRFDEIPGNTYAIGFLRSYAGFLALDPDELVDAFKREQGLESGEQRLAFPSPSDTSPKPRFWLILLVLVLAGLAYGGWQYQSTGSQIATDLVDDVSTRLTEAVGLGTEEAAQATGTTETTQITQEPAAVATDDASAASATVGAEESAATAPAEAAISDSSPADPAPEGPAPTSVATGDATIPAAESWDETGTEQAADAAAIDGAREDGEPIPPAPPKAEAASDAAPVTSAPAAPAAPGETAQQAEAAAPTESGGAGEAAGTAVEQRPAVAAPLDLAAAQVGGSGGAEEAVAGPDAPTAASAASAESAVSAEALPVIETEPVEVVALQELPPLAQEQPAQPAADTAGEGTAAPQVPGADETWPAAESGYVPKVYGRSNADARVVITATDDSWVQVQGPDNELLLTRILHTGDSYRVPDRPGLVMVTGNAGGLEIRVDDAPAPALGPLGVVMRNIALDPDRLLAGTATGG